jgi:ribonuclease HI
MPVADFGQMYPWNSMAVNILILSSHNSDTNYHKQPYTKTKMVVYDENFEEIRRLYDPSEDEVSRPVPLDELVFYNTVKQVSQLQMKVRARPSPVPDESSLVVRIDGACRGNGTPAAKASYGVYFGPGSSYNTYGLLPSSAPQTSMRAEIEALKQALRVICEITDKDYQLMYIKIATDSSFLVNAMSRWMERWIEDGGIESNGKEVAHFEYLKALHEKLDYMAYSDDGGREVQFWHVPRERNCEADRLANKALNEL